MYTYSQIHGMSGQDVAATFGLTAQAANALRQMAKAQMNTGKGGNVYTPRGTAGPAVAGVKLPGNRKEPRTSELANGLLVAALNAGLYGLGVENTKSAVLAVLEDEGKRAVVSALFANMPGLDPASALEEVDAWAGVRSPEQRRQAECERIYRALVNAHQAAKQQEVVAEALRRSGWSCEAPVSFGYRAVLGLDTAVLAEMVSRTDLEALSRLEADCGL